MEDDDSTDFKTAEELLDDLYKFLQSTLPSDGDVRDGGAKMSTDHRNVRTCIDAKPAGQGKEPVRSSHRKLQDGVIEFFPNSCSSRRRHRSFDPGEPQPRSRSQSVDSVTLRESAEEDKQLGSKKRKSLDSREQAKFSKVSKENIAALKEVKKKQKPKLWLRSEAQAKYKQMQQKTMKENVKKIEEDKKMKVLTEDLNSSPVDLILNSSRVESILRQNCATEHNSSTKKHKKSKIVLSIDAGEDKSPGSSMPLLCSSTPHNVYSDISDTSEVHYSDISSVDETVALDTTDISSEDEDRLLQFENEVTQCAENNGDEKCHNNVFEVSQSEETQELTSSMEMVVAPEAVSTPKREKKHSPTRDGTITKHCPHNSEGITHEFHSFAVKAEASFEDSDKKIKSLERDLELCLSTVAENLQLEARYQLELESTVAKYKQLIRLTVSERKEQEKRAEELKKSKEKLVKDRDEKMKKFRRLMEDFENVPPSVKRSRLEDEDDDTDDSSTTQVIESGNSQKTDSHPVITEDDKRLIREHVDLLPQKLLLGLMAESKVGEFLRKSSDELEINATERKILCRLLPLCEKHGGEYWICLFAGDISRSRDLKTELNTSFDSVDPCAATQPVEQIPVKTEESRAPVVVKTEDQTNELQELRRRFEDARLKLCYVSEELCDSQEKDLFSQDTFDLMLDNCQHRLLILQRAENKVVESGGEHKSPYTEIFSILKELKRLLINKEQQTSVRCEDSTKPETTNNSVDSGNPSTPSDTGKPSLRVKPLEKMQSRPPPLVSMFQKPTPTVPVEYTSPAANMCLPVHLSNTVTTPVGFPPHQQQLPLNQYHTNQTPVTGQQITGYGSNQTPVREQQITGYGSNQTPVTGQQITGYGSNQTPVTGQQITGYGSNQTPVTGQQITGYGINQRIPVSIGYNGNHNMAATPDRITLNMNSGTPHSSSYHPINNQNSFYVNTTNMNNNNNLPLNFNHQYPIYNNIPNMPGSSSSSGYTNFHTNNQNFSNTHQRQFGDYQRHGVASNQFTQQTQQFMSQTFSGSPNRRQMSQPHSQYWSPRNNR